MARTRLRVVISAGPTREPIDPVRFVSNYSTGYMGAQVAREARERGHRVTVVSGPVSEPPPAGVRVIGVERAADMARAMHREAARADVLIMAAAVADFTPVRLAAGKMRRQAGIRTLFLKPTPDILRSLPRREGQLIAGFAVESRRVLQRARRKLLDKRLDALVAQAVESGRPRRSLSASVVGSHAPFGRRAVRAWLLTRDGEVSRLPRDKGLIARRLLDKLEALWYGQHRHPQAPKGHSVT